MKHLTPEEKKEHRRLANKRSHDKTYAHRIKNNLCIVCGKAPRTKGFCSCSSCRIKVNRTQRHLREKASLKIVDKLMDRGLITTLEASVILGVKRDALYRHIRSGELKVYSRRALTYSRTFWLSQTEVNKLLRKMQPNIKCSTCGHAWHTELPKPKRCPRLFCRSTIIKRLPVSYNHNNPPKRFKPTVTILNPEQLKEMIRDKNNGESIRFICKKYKISTHTIYKYWYKSMNTHQ